MVINQGHLWQLTSSLRGPRIAGISLQFCRSAHGFLNASVRFGHGIAKLKRLNQDRDQKTTCDERRRQPWPQLPALTHGADYLHVRKRTEPGH
jgi:hypothetical protein